MEHDPLCDGRCIYYILSDRDLADRHREVDELFGDEAGCGGTWGWEPPCGGCVDCGHGMVSHSFYKQREEARLYHEAGFEWAPYVVDNNKIFKAGGRFGSWGEKHDEWDCRSAGEEARWPKSESSSSSTGSVSESTA